MLGRAAVEDSVLECKLHVLIALFVLYVRAYSMCAVPTRPDATPGRPRWPPPAAESAPENCSSALARGQDPRHRARPSSPNLTSTGLAQNLDPLLGSYRDFQSNFWVNLRILGQPCEFYLPVLARGRGAAPEAAAGRLRRRQAGGGAAAAAAPTRP
jgi:hypothetical protein